MIYLDNNPCWPPEKEITLRIEFLGKITQMDTLGATLKYLNGYEIKISERV